LFYTSALEGGEGSVWRPSRFLPPGKTRYPLYKRLDGPQGRSGQVRNISPPPGFDPQTVQPVASRYTDWATRPTGLQLTNRKTGKIVALYHRELFKKIPDLGTFCNQLVKEGLKKTVHWVTD
jgi:hypothetical protein